LTPSMSQLGSAAGPLLQFATGAPGPGGAGQPLEQFLFPNMNQVNLHPILIYKTNVKVISNFHLI
jgi:hypothetical protein